MQSASACSTTAGSTAACRRTPRRRAGEPSATPALWVRTAKEGEIPVWVQPTGAHDAYNKGDRVHYPSATDPVYESLIDANVYSPEAYPQGWQLVE